MRTLMLLRHAKSSWDDAALGDHERPLNKRGTRDGTRIGSYMAGNGLRPDLVLCSDAVRARATLTLLLPAFAGDTPDVTFDPRLYLAEPPAILEVLAKVEPVHRQCLIVAHNPGMHALALELVGEGERKDLAELAMKFPTGALAVIDFETDGWTPLKPGLGRLRAFIQPRKLG